MRKWRFAGAAVLLAGLGWWLARNSAIWSELNPEIPAGRADSRAGGSWIGDSGVPRPAKISVRPTEVTRATHSPAQLREFYLPPVEIDGLTLAAAVEKLRAAYEEACLQSGEVPVRLSFVIPPGAGNLIHLKLPARNLDGSLRVLAAVSRMKVRRDGAEYLFEEAAGTGIEVKKELHARPDLMARLREMAGRELPEGAGLRERLEALGLALDPATRISYNPPWGTVVLESATAADVAGIAALLGIFGKESPLQQKLDSKIVRLPAGMDWTPPDSSRMSDADVFAMMRQVGQTEGVELSTNPSVSARNGEIARIDLTRELIAPVPGSDGEFETHPVGRVFEYHPSLLGFGHSLEMSFKDIAGDIDPASGGVTITKIPRLKGSGYVGDRQTLVQVQTHPDGSRTVLMVTPTMIDATGRPVRPLE